MITDATIEAFLDYHSLSIVEGRLVGSWEGDEIVVVRNPATGQFGILVHGYGSCSGCDTLQAFDADLDRYRPQGDPAVGDQEKYDAECQSLTDYAATVINSIDWFDSASSAAAELAYRATNENDKNLWYSYEDEYLLAFAELSAATLLYESDNPISVDVPRLG